MANEKFKYSGQPEDKSEGWSQAALSAKNAMNSTKSVDKLNNIGKTIVTNPKWAPHDNMTFCNCAVAHAALQYGYDGFYDAGLPLMANSMISKMARDTDNWKAVTSTDAWHLALDGGLSVACYSEAPHGHVAVVAPGARVWSDKFAGYCPLVFNVGKTMNTTMPYSMGENFAFLMKPNHYNYVGSK